MFKFESATPPAKKTEGQAWASEAEEKAFLKDLAKDQVSKKMREAKGESPTTAYVEKVKEKRSSRPEAKPF